MIGNRSAEQLNRSLGIRADEGQTVRLFFLHNFLLGVGTMLVYVAANVILLENNPETSLPVAYIASALGMIGMGRIYAYFEHHLPLSRLVVRVLWAVILLTAVISVLVAFGHSVAAAVAIMVGFRGIYLLTNLEFWAISALVFDVRQSKRLFSVISSGDLPAKALGAVLAALIHGHSTLLVLLMVAFAFFGAALYVTALTIRLHDVHAPHAPARPTRRPQDRWVGQFFGGSELIRAVCLSLIPVAMVAAGIEYEFFINVKHKVHHQAAVMTYLGYVLALTYLVAMIVKLLASRRTLERFGILNTLRLLPWATLGWVLLYGFVATRPDDENMQMLFLCGLYLVFEVVRRALFDPVLLVLFQPLPAGQRLKGHTLAKGMFEPLGMGIAGVLLFLLGEQTINADWMLLAGIGLTSLTLIPLLGSTYRHYLHTLQDALGRRFIAAHDLVLPAEATAVIARELDNPRPERVLAALDYLPADHPALLTDRATPLLHHTDVRVRARTLEIATDRAIALPAANLTERVLNDPDPTVRQQAAQLLATQSKDALQTGLLSTSDRAVRQGAIIGFYGHTSGRAPALASLNALMQGQNSTDQKVVLACIEALRLTDRGAYVQSALRSSDASVVSAALGAGSVQTDPAIWPQLVSFLTDRQHGRTAVRALAGVGDAVLPALPMPLSATDNPLLLRRTIAVVDRIRSGVGPREAGQGRAAQTWLLDMLPHTPVPMRAALLKSLTAYTVSDGTEHLYEQLVTEDLQLAQRLLHGQAKVASNTLMAEAVQYEIDGLVDRLLLLMMGLHDKETVNSVRQSLDHQAQERRANSLELLENLIPRPVYGTLLALTDDLPLAERVALADSSVGPFDGSTDLITFIRQHGQTRFTPWTVLVAQQTTAQQPNATAPMNHAPAHPSPSSDIERVLVLRNSSLFATTPANVLSTIAPIMKETRHAEGDVLVQKGEIGTFMFIIQQGEVGVFDGDRQLATLREGDVVGELSLLDAEPRSATVVALSDMVLFRIDQADFYDLMEERDEIMQNIIRMLCGRIRAQNQKKG
ncbi:MAG: Crp/Fnr family transcriptional regulator [Cytophagales bacterium]|nr:MAG: Crp/Fnr family transcriptional regulator [Cytophagales bacterium]